MRRRFSVFGVTRFRCRQKADNGGAERKTRSVPRSLVQGEMEGPLEGEGEGERHPAALCEKKERGSNGVQNKQTHELECMPEDLTLIWITKLVRTSDFFYPSS